MAKTNAERCRASYYRRTGRPVPNPRLPIAVPLPPIPVGKLTKEELIKALALRLRQPYLSDREFGQLAQQYMDLQGWRSTLTTRRQFKDLGRALRGKNNGKKPDAVQSVTLDPLISEMESSGEK